QVAEDEGQAQGGQHRAEDVAAGDVHHGDGQRGEGQDVDEDIEREPEEGVRVPSGPPGQGQPGGGLGFVGEFRIDGHGLFLARGGGRTHADVLVEVEAASAPMTAAESATQPNIAPWAAIMSRPTRWNSGKYEPTQSE